MCDGHLATTTAATTTAAADDRADDPTYISQEDVNEYLEEMTEMFGNVLRVYDTSADVFAALFKENFAFDQGFYDMEETRPITTPDKIAMCSGTRPSSKVETLRFHMPAPGMCEEHTSILVRIGASDVDGKFRVFGISGYFAPAASIKVWMRSVDDKLEGKVTLKTWDDRTVFECQLAEPVDLCAKVMEVVPGAYPVHGLFFESLRRAAHLKCV